MIDINIHDANVSVSSFDRSNSNAITIQLNSELQITLFGLPDIQLNSLLDAFSTPLTHDFSEAA